MNENIIQKLRIKIIEKVELKMEKTTEKQLVQLPMEKVSRFVSVEVTVDLQIVIKKHTKKGEVESFDSIEQLQEECSALTTKQIEKVVEHLEQNMNEFTSTFTVTEESEQVESDEKEDVTVSEALKPMKTVEYAKKQKERAFSMYMSQKHIDLIDGETSDMQEKLKAEYRAWQREVKRRVQGKEPKLSVA